MAVPQMVNLRADVVVSGGGPERGAIRYAQLIKSEIQALQAGGHTILEISVLVRKCLQGCFQDLSGDEVGNTRLTDLWGEGGHSGCEIMINMKPLSILLSDTCS